MTRTLASNECLSVLTPVGPGSLPWLQETADSVQRTKARLDGAVRLEWVVCWDGVAPAPLEAADRQVHWARRGGVAAARNAALAVSTGDWVLPLDADDLLEPDGVSALLEVIRGAETIEWIGANRRLTDGQRTRHWFNDPVDVPIGHLATTWRSPFPFHPNTLVVTSTLAKRVGGWPAIPVNEDLAFALLLSEHAPGLLSPEPLIRYRLWDGQTVNDPTYQADKATAFHVIETTINAIRIANGRTPSHAPPAGPAYGLEVLANHQP